MMHDRLRASLLILLAVGGSIGRAVASPDATIVVANGNVGASVELARTYMEKRGIPDHHLCILDLPSSEAISRKVYEKRLRDPLLSFLREGMFIEQLARQPESIRKHETAWTTTRSSVRYLVSLYGVPLRIRDTRTWLASKLADYLKRPAVKNGAAVDSELSLLLFPPYECAGVIRNPLFKRRHRGELTGAGALLLAATRLDGPSPGVVRRMIDDTLEAEHYGLQGRAVFDENAASGTYEKGDAWIRGAAEHFSRQGYAVTRNTTADEIGAETDLDDVAVYMGWYAQHVTGPFADTSFSFQKGAVAYHIHSGSAKTLRSNNRYWAGPLLERGAVATMGAVSEPFLLLTPHLDIFSERLCGGETFADSAYMSLSHLSWQMTVVGDPLYRPFRHSLERQVNHLSEDAQPDLSWAYVRKANRLARAGKTAAAIRFLEGELEEKEDTILRRAMNELSGPVNGASKEGD